MSVAERKKQQLQQLKQVSLYNQGQKDGIEDTIWLALWSLHTKFGFGKKRLTEFYREVVNQAECMIAGNLSLDDVKKALEEECKISVGKVKMR